jgi:two-component system phosphate regulon sensor histidine kinase PhoR
MPDEKIIIVSTDTSTVSTLENVVLRPAGYQVTALRDCKVAEELIKASLPDLVFLGEKVENGDGIGFASTLLERFPGLILIMLPESPSVELEVAALRVGVSDYIIPPVRAEEVLAIVRRSLERKQRFEEWVRLQSRRNTKSLQNKVDNLEALQRVGRSVTALLDLDSILKAVVDAAVDLTNAEEGSLLLLDETTGELYMRASRNFQEDFVNTFRLPIRDSLPGQVLRSGKPLLINDDTPRKIKTAYLVRTLIYVPLEVQGRMIGILGVDNRHGGHPFTDQDVTLISALADYAAIAIENANLFSRTEIERKKLEAILTQVEDGVIVVDVEGRVMLINHTVRAAFDLPDESMVGKPIRDIIQHPDVLEIFGDEKHQLPSQREIVLDDGRVFNAQITPIQEIGMAVTMQDITHLKELDRIKSEFVSTVSHDLRSPLTAILGYVELIDRVGPVNDTQREFIHRVQASVSNITSLINDLLDLGRIEAGFDALKDIVPIGPIIRFAVDNLRSRYEEKNQEVTLEISENLPAVLGNPVRLRQMIGNLVGNAVKYTQPGGKIIVRGVSRDDQFIFQVIDNGPGIPPGEQPYIFDKFYRASNVSSESNGTGLGLAIVKSIIENHQGRVWVDSILGQGATFTVVLPISIDGQ